MEKNNKPTSQESSRSWFCVLNLHLIYLIVDLESQTENTKRLKLLFGDKTPDEIVDTAIELWCMNKPQRTCAVNYEIGDTGNEHLHLVLEDPAKTRFSAVQKLFPGIHIEQTKGTKQQAEDYINKVGRFAEKNHTVVVPARYKGQIKAQQGTRNDLSVIEELIEQGKTPREIMDISIFYRKFEKMIRGAFFAKRLRETPIKRDVKVVWHTGESGTGKSYTYIKLCEEYGEDKVYLMTDYSNGGVDMYCAEPIVFMDELKVGNLNFSTFLGYLDSYRIQIHCRYENSYALWNEVHITSVFSPEEVFDIIVDTEHRGRDKIKQLLRRIDTIVFHYKQGSEYKQFEMNCSEYINYDELKQKALADENGFIHENDKENPYTKQINNKEN